MVSLVHTANITTESMLGLSPYLDVGPCGFLSGLFSTERQSFLVIAVATHSGGLNNLVSPTSDSNLHGCT